jgi:hypothetical protein
LRHKGSILYCGRGCEFSQKALPHFGRLVKLAGGQYRIQTASRDHIGFENGANVSL